MGVFNGSGNVLLNTTDTCRFRASGRAMGADHQLTIRLLRERLETNEARRRLFLGGGFLGGHLGQGCEYTL